METHAALLELCDPAPAEIAVGATLALTVRLTCPAGCNLAEVPIAVKMPDGSAVTVPPAGTGEPGRTIALAAPRAVGAHAWPVMVEPGEVLGIRHEAAPLVVAVKVVPQETSLAVWDMPSPVVRGQRFAVKVGAKSAAACDLKGCRVEIRDESDAVMATGCLGASPWPGTSALYWAELELVAPSTPGMFGWSVRFEAADVPLAHRGASARFSIPIVEPPEHRLTVKVVEQLTAVPVADAQVRLGAFRGVTDDAGFAQIMMPKGTYEIGVWKSGYEAPAQTVAIADDLAIEIAVVALPEEDPDAAWLM